MAAGAAGQGAGAPEGPAPTLTPPPAEAPGSLDVPPGVLLPDLRPGTEAATRPLLDPCGQSTPDPSDALRTARRSGGGPSLGQSVAAYRDGGAELALAGLRRALAACPTRDYVADGVALRNLLTEVPAPEAGTDRLLVSITTVDRTTGERVGGSAAVGVVRRGNAVTVLRVFGPGEPGLGSVGRAMLDAATLLCYYSQDCR